MNIIENLESEVRSYCRSFPCTFVKSKGCFMYDEDGNEYLDFFAGAGALNYGHNNDALKNKIVEYIQNDGIMHGLDMTTAAKKEFLEKFNETILKPRDLDYKVMFCGPTGTNAVESALKLARKYTKRTTVFAFSGAFHGMTLGSLAVTSNSAKRAGAAVGLDNVVFMPYPFGFNATFDTIGYIENILTDDHSGVEKPAAIIVETVQAEGGIVVAEIEWLQRLRKLCTEHGILLICDDIQIGCGRTGTFFSFERAGIVPDMVTLSKSISGFGLPMALMLMKRELDIWHPGEHNGTFRGNQLAFVGAKEALNYYDNWILMESVKKHENTVNKFFEENIKPIDQRIQHRGIGLIHGFDFSLIGKGIASAIARECLKNGLIIETAGREDSVLKLLPPLVITDSELLQGLNAILKSTKTVLGAE